MKDNGKGRGWRRHHRRETHPALIICLCIAILLSMFLPTSRNVARMADIPESPVTLEPSWQEIGLGETAAIEVWVNYVSDLYGAEVHLIFDPTVLEVQDADDDPSNGAQIEPGSFLPSGWGDTPPSDWAGGWPPDYDPYFVAQNQVDNENGTIDFAFTLVRPADSLWGSGPIASITFLRLTEGDASVEFYNSAQPDEPAVKLADSQGNPLFIGTSESAMVATPGVGVRLTPDWQEIGTGETATLDIRIENVSDLYAAEVHLIFDPTLLEVQDADDNPANGVQIEPGSFLPTGWGDTPPPDWTSDWPPVYDTYFVARNQVDNDSGTIDFAVVLLNPAEPLWGSGVLASITFLCKDAGETSIEFYNTELPWEEPVKLADNQGSPIAISDVEGAMISQVWVAWQLNIAGSIAQVYFDNIAAGFNLSASEGRDAYDTPEPSPPEPPYLDLYFSVEAERLTQDMRPPDDSQSWTFQVHTADLAEDVTLTWDLSQLPSDISFILLKDESSGAITDMFTNSSYTYSSASGEARIFDLLIRTNHPPEVTVIYPNGGEREGWVVEVVAEAADPDVIPPYNDRIVQVLFVYSPDGGANWEWIDLDTDGSDGWSVLWDTTGLEIGDNYLILAAAVDSFDWVSYDTSDAAFSLAEILWEIAITGSITENGETSLDTVSAGVGPAAAQGEDGYDMPNPPPPPEPLSLDLYFAQDSLKFSRDIRSLGYPQIWALKAARAGAAEDITLNWDISEVPSRVAFILQDQATGSFMDMRESTSYIYSTAEDEVRTFDLLVNRNTPPTVAVIYPNGGEMVSATVSVIAIASDVDAIAPYNDYVAEMKFEYSSDNGLSWTFIGADTDGSDGWSASWDTLQVPEDSNYLMRATATDSRGATGRDTSDTTFTVVHRLAVSTTFARGWNMFSLPLYPDPAGFSSQLGDDIFPLYVYHYDPATRSYSLPATGTPGEGYWVRVSADTPVDMDGFPVSTGADFVLSLGRGWNQIGQPFNFSVDWGEVKVEYQEQIVSIEQAHANNWVRKWLYSYNPVSRTYDVAGAPNGQLDPLQGYWIRAVVDGAQLLIPATPIS